MKYDRSKITTIEDDFIFIKTHKFEFYIECMKINDDPESMTDNQIEEIQLKAIDHIAEKCGYGPFAHLCDSCTMKIATCTAIHDEDVMFGYAKGNDNVCFCKKFTLIEG